MNGSQVYDPAAITARLREHASREAIRISVHAHQEMFAEGISYDQVRGVLLEARVVENYLEHKRGPCCLICRRTAGGRFIHVVCTTSLEVVVIITVYEPLPPKWATPFERGKTE